MKRDFAFDIAFGAAAASMVVYLVKGGAVFWLIALADASMAGLIYFANAQHRTGRQA